MQLQAKLKIYYVTAILSVCFAVIGFSYNAWRLEITEDNNNIRTAAFEVLTNLSELEQVVFYAHFDQDEVEGNPRKGWIKVGLILDLTSLVSDGSLKKAKTLKQTWSENWSHMVTDREAADSIVRDIENVRREVKITLAQLD